MPWMAVGGQHGGAKRKSQRGLCTWHYFAKFMGIGRAINGLSFADRTFKALRSNRLYRIWQSSVKQC